MLLLPAFFVLKYSVSSVLDVFVFFFFFQAEDGIRDLIVTGVQTCALPIWIDAEALAEDRVDVAAVALHSPTPVPGLGELACSREQGQARRADRDAGARRFRSEERRVGEEGRSRWSPYH